MPYPKSQALFARAQQLIPGGIHLSGRPLVHPDHTPMYMAHGAGCRVWDVDDHEYIDYLMAFGPFLLGYANAEVDEAAIAQLRRGPLLTMNHPLHLTLIERLVARFPGAEMGVLFKTGSEATTAALRIARRATGRREVVRCGYHGWHDWCLPHEDYVPRGLAEQIHEARDPIALAQVLAARPGAIAAVIVAPEMITPFDPEALRRFASVTRAHGAVFVLDEVKTAFRFAPGSLQQWAGVIPDVTTVSKALGNGWAVAAVIGTRAVMESGAGIHYSATFHGDTAAMAAALKVLDILDRGGVAEHVWAQGEKLITGLNAATARHGVRAEAYGEPLPPMPFLRFTHPDEATNARVKDAFYTRLLELGVLIHPRHMGFLSISHSDDDLARTLERCDEALAHAGRVEAAGDHAAATATSR